MAVVGVGLDLITWITPHYVVWGLRLRRAHKLAITAIFAFGILTIVIGVFRITAIADAPVDSDLTYGIGINLLWALAQMSTGIIVACLPHLRPAFEKVVPRRLTRIATRSNTRLRLNGGEPQTPRQNSIAVTTKIEVDNAFPSPALSAPFHDGHQEPWAPTFEVVNTLAVPQQHTMLCREGPPRAVGCCCLRA
ncbi:hypothetical protein BU25DRAFT_429826 [Macroventuria anomochaeta]|uniref:Uncharacterized protein n=1 Tax=Macroventuria anomochaeta TaxID=301207 RepID=A0ACB6S675_9PLEO|nr:uncharacterized protein BU25DRAFT_429826 [Macroventuria anomochaeta]KAF2629538.1 hypothetical protein BU25DRAFT_429826 [Macroventuria anomochaeta]